MSSQGISEIEDEVESHSVCQRTAISFDKLFYYMQLSYHVIIVMHNIPLNKERERERTFVVCLCMCVRARARVCVCVRARVCVWLRERERESYGPSQWPDFETNDGNGILVQSTKNVYTEFKTMGRVLLLMRFKISHHKQPTTANNVHSSQLGNKSGI